MELVDLLTKNLGISPEQARGGAGLVLKRAKDNLGAEDFSKISAAAPQVDILISFLPATGDSVIGEVEKLFSIFGKKAGNVGSAARVRAGFFKLGLNAEMIEKFEKVILAFVQDKGGDGAGKLMEKGLAAE